MARMLLHCGVVDTLNYPLGGLKPCMSAMRTLRKRQTRGAAVIEGHNKTNFDLPAKVFY